MTGIPDYNYPEFERVTGLLRAEGFDVISPHEHSLDRNNPSYDWCFWLRLGIQQLIQCDRVAYLNGWRGSRGAVAEISLASNLGMCPRLWEWFLNGNYRLDVPTWRV
jgi:hypothetical protein